MTISCKSRRSSPGDPQSRGGPNSPRVVPVSREPVVAVCTNRGPAAVAESLAALAGQAPADRILVVTSGLTSQKAAQHRAESPGVVAEESRAGLSLARNRALEWASAEGAGVIAYVDDDAVVDPGWWDTLRRQWAD